MGWVGGGGGGGGGWGVGGGGGGVSIYHYSILTGGSLYHGGQKYYLIPAPHFRQVTVTHPKNSHPCHGVQCTNGTRGNCSSI